MVIVPALAGTAASLPVEEDAAGAAERAGAVS
jgi:hypothetical protein